MSYERKKKTHFKYFKVWGCLTMVNILVNKKILVIYYKVNEYIYLTILPSNVILFVSTYGNMSNFFEIIE